MYPSLFYAFLNTALPSFSVHGSWLGLKIDARWNCCFVFSKNRRKHEKEKDLAISGSPDEKKQTNINKERECKQLTSPSLSSLVYVSIRPNPISERDWRRLVLVNGPSKIGLLLDCLARKASGMRRSAGNDRRLLMSCYIINKTKDKLLAPIDQKMEEKKKIYYLGKTPILLAHLDGWRDVRIRGQWHFFRFSIRSNPRVFVQDACNKATANSTKQSDSRAFVYSSCSSTVFAH